MPFGLTYSIAIMRMHLSWRLRARRACVGVAYRQVRRVEIVFAGDPNQGEQGVAAGVREGRPHLMRRRRFTDRAYRPVGRDPFSGRMGEDRGQANKAGILVDRSCLHGRDLVLAERLANNVEPSRKRCIAKRAIAFPREWRSF